MLVIRPVRGEDIDYLLELAGHSVGFGQRYGRFEYDINITCSRIKGDQHDGLLELTRDIDEFPAFVTWAGQLHELADGGVYALNVRLDEIQLFLHGTIHAGSPDHLYDG